jgi:hypothetical protein
MSLMKRLNNNQLSGATATERPPAAGPATPYPPPLPSRETPPSGMSGLPGATGTSNGAGVPGGPAATGMLKRPVTTGNGAAAALPNVLGVVRKAP